MREIDLVRHIVYWEPLKEFNLEAKIEEQIINDIRNEPDTGHQKASTTTS